MCMYNNINKCECCTLANCWRGGGRGLWSTPDRVCARVNTDAETDQKLSHIYLNTAHKWCNASVADG